MIMVMIGFKIKVVFFDFMGICFDWYSVVISVFLRGVF